MIALGYLTSRGGTKTRQATGLIEPMSNSGPCFAAVAIAFNNDPNILGAMTGILLVQLVVGVVVASFFGKESNASGVGTRIVVRAGKGTFVREVLCGRGNSSQDSLIAHVGLGRFKGTVDVEVRWPSGKVHREKMKALRRHILQEK